MNAREKKTDLGFFLNERFFFKKTGNGEVRLPRGRAPARLRRRGCGARAARGEGRGDGSINRGGGGDLGEGVAGGSRAGAGLGHGGGGVSCARRRGARGGPAAWLGCGPVRRAQFFFLKKNKFRGK